MAVLLITALISLQATTTVAVLSNVALLKPAAQSSTIKRIDLQGLTADKAVDGNTDATLDSNLQHTADFGEGDTNPTRWWMVDLLEFFEIHAVVIYNRKTCCSGRLQNFEIQTFMHNPMVVSTAAKTVCFRYTTAMGPVTTRFSCSAPSIGRFVRVIMPTNMDNPMHMIEVEVLAQATATKSKMFSKSTGVAAQGGVIEDVTTTCTTRCIMTCMHTAGCNAVNVGPAKGAAVRCQLLSYGEIKLTYSFTTQSGWAFMLTSSLI